MCMKVSIVLSLIALCETGLDPNRDLELQGYLDSRALCRSVLYHRSINEIGSGILSWRPGTISCWNSPALIFQGKITWRDHLPCTCSQSQHCQYLPCLPLQEEQGLSPVWAETVFGLILGSVSSEFIWNILLILPFPQLPRPPILFSLIPNHKQYLFPKWKCQTFRNIFMKK